MSKEKIKNFFGDVFSIHTNKLTKAEVKENIVAGSKVKGTNMCILMLAIIISCVGLNMNSDEMIIGAMLISPMMGAIVGIAYALATGDIKFLKRAAVALLIQVAISFVTSTLYFIISPISAPSTALLGRTVPTIWDVIIAIAGGLAGAIGLTRKDKGNILPGVAIATGLIPPICTAGYGLSVLNIHYLLSALYLFFINAFFICVSAMIVFKIMKMPKKKGETKKEELKIKRDLIMIAIITIIPSILLAYPVVKQSSLEGKVQKYINNEFNYESTQIVKSNIDVKNNKIELAIIGKVLNEEEIMNLTNKLKDYELQNMNLKIAQTEVENGVSKEEIKNQIVDTNSKENQSSVSIENIATVNVDKIKDELKSKNEKIAECNITNSKISTNNGYIQSYIITILLNEDITNEEEADINKYLYENLGYNISINKTVK